MIASPSRFEDSRQRFERLLSQTLHLIRERCSREFPSSIFYAYKQQVEGEGWKDIYRLGNYADGTGASWLRDSRHMADENRAARSQSANWIKRTSLFRHSGLSATRGRSTGRYSADSFWMSLRPSCRLPWTNSLVRATSRRLTCGKPPSGRAWRSTRNIAGGRDHWRGSQCRCGQRSRKSIGLLTNTPKIKKENWTRKQGFCLTWLKQYGFRQEDYGVAQDLSRSQDVVVETLRDFNRLLNASAGLVRLPVPR